MVEAGRQGLKLVEALLRETHEAALGTVEEGRPFVSATGFLYQASDDFPAGGKIHILLSHLARHTRNLLKCPDASLLIVENKSGIPIHEKKRVSLQGKVERVEDKAKHETLKREYLKIFPRSEVFFTLPDFRFYEFQVSQIHWIGGFGKALTWP
ncbi:MAG: pyridoxamine 5'-phosphate oxidase family protein [Candidatus Omnitrophica bacterium]|nr:pyridoxamine 5'-phosphate oxidase family protein [Candidatus Omnitrophota bacterium]